MTQSSTPDKAQFQYQDCSLTLGQGLDEFYTLNADKFSKPVAAMKWSDLMAAHDACHVLFGVNTSMVEEAHGDVWTLLATTMTFSEYAKFAKSDEARELIQSNGLWNTLIGSIKSVPGALSIVLRARKMSKKWDAWHYRDHLSEKLCDLRQKHNLKILPA